MESGRLQDERGKKIPPSDVLFFLSSKWRGRLRLGSFPPSRGLVRSNYESSDKVTVTQGGECQPLPPHQPLPPAVSTTSNESGGNAHPIQTAEKHHRRHTEFCSTEDVWVWMTPPDRWKNGQQNGHKDRTRSSPIWPSLTLFSAHRRHDFRTILCVK